MDFFELMKSARITPAMEADDITGQVNAETAKAGGISQKKQQKADDEMNNTNDIFGVADTDTNNDIVPPGTATNQASQDTPDNTGGGNLDLDNAGGNDPSMGGNDQGMDGGGDDPGSDDGMDGSDMGDDGSGDASGSDLDGGDSGSDMGGGDMGSPDVDQEEQTPELVKLENLRKNMIEFHAMVSGNLKLISENTPDILPEQSSNLTGVIANLRECKNVLYDLIVEKFNSYTYAKLLSSYVAIQRAYELSAIMLEKYFDQLDIIDEERANQKELRDKRAKKTSASLAKN